MRKLILLIAPLAVLVLLMAGCSNNDETTAPQTKTLTLHFEGLQNLGPDFAYEGWIVVNGNPVSTGVFTVDDNGDLSDSTFEVNADNLDAATKFVLTIEPSPDTDPSPSNTHYLAGDFADGMATLTVADGAAFDDDFSTAAGKYILATPTNGSESNENSGIWFLDISSGEPAVGLMLPSLPDGWLYEGWAVIGGTPVTTGKFSEVDQADNAAPYSGTSPGPPFPGEDFLNNAPSGLTFPTDLSDGMGVITIEPDPDNSAAPFTLKPLVASIPSDATDHHTYDMTNNIASFPIGAATR